MAIDADSSAIPHAPAEARAGHGAPRADGPADPTALTVEQLAKMLAVPAEKVRGHVTAGAPTGQDGTINLVHYAAWLNRRLKDLDGD